MKKIVLGILVLMLFAAVAAVPAEAATLRIVNDTGYTVYYLRISPNSSSEWGADRLGSSVLSNGESFSVSVSNGRYDIQLEDEDEDTYTKMNVSVSDDTTVAFTISDID